MQLTEYAILGDYELIDMVLMDANATHRELEMAQRMEIMKEMLGENGANTGRTGESGVQEAA